MILIISLIGLHKILAESSENDAAREYGPKAEEFCNDFYDKDENTKVKYLGKSHVSQFGDVRPVGEKISSVSSTCHQHVSPTSIERRVFLEFFLGTLTVTIRGGSPQPLNIVGPQRSHIPKILQGTPPEIKFRNFWWYQLKPEDQL